MGGNKGWVESNGTLNINIILSGIGPEVSQFLYLQGSKNKKYVSGLKL